jgi:hypothetical protein
MARTIRKNSDANHNTRKCDVCRRDRLKGNEILKLRVADEMALLAVDEYALDIEAAHAEAADVQDAILDAESFAEFEERGRRMAEAASDEDYDQDLTAAWQRIEQEMIASAMRRLEVGNSRMRETYA